MVQLPITSALPRLQQLLTQSSQVILQAPPGAGKTTAVPPALLAESWLAGRKIIMLEPRRLATRAAAYRIAQQLEDRIGGLVGYQIRFERKISTTTRIEIVTEGILTRRLQRDPALADVGLVIFDEFHERNLHADLALALCLESQAVLRNDLRILLMSATLDETAVTALLPTAPVLNTPGRTYPVQILYMDRTTDDSIATALSTTLHALTQLTGDILIFLPGSTEIRRLASLLREHLDEKVALLPLYGDLPFEQQQLALQPDPAQRRKIVLATPIAETSLTIEGISVVIDSGLARVPRFDPRSGLSRLQTVRISADSATQRAGRAGRLGPGYCYRLWTEEAHKRLAAHRRAEIQDADLAPLLLEVACWGTTDIQHLSWIDTPPTGALQQARSLLHDLQALDKKDRITPLGRQLAALPLHPRLAHMLIRARDLDLGALACDLAALLDGRDILRGSASRDCDVQTRIDALNAWRQQDSAQLQALGADRMACAQIERSASQLRKLLRITTESINADTACGLLLALAYPDRIARRRPDSARDYHLSNGRSARLPAGDPLQKCLWLSVAQLDGSLKDGRIYLAAKVDLADLERHLSTRFTTTDVIRWDSQEQAVLAQRERRFGALQIAQTTLSEPDPAQLRNAMLEGIRELGLDCLPWTPALRQWQARVQTLHHYCPATGWPDVSDDWLSTHLPLWLEPFLDGITRRSHLSRLDLTAALHTLLDWHLQSQLTHAAPSHLSVPSGSRIRLHYQPPEPPVLAVKLQELFGLVDTPKLAEGRVPVILHLLSPAQRPIQITRDLRSFWASTYHEVKKELKGRYPKHPWPDDPWSAPATRRTKPK